MARQQLRIEQGSNTITLPATRTETARDLDEMGRAEAVVYRDDWKSVEDDIDEDNDKLFIDVDGTQEFGGRFDDAKTTETKVTVRIVSPEQDADDYAPTSDQFVRENKDDDTIVTDLLSPVPSLSAGTVNTVAPSISYTASFASRREAVRGVREQTGGEVRYNSDFTYDYVDALGTDKTGSVTLGPANSNVGTDFSKTRDQRKRTTHLLVLGGEEGPGQREAVIVPDDDSIDWTNDSNSQPTFENQTTYSASSWSDGDRRLWALYANKEVLDISRLEDIGTQIVLEADGSPRALAVECSAFDESLVLGDEVTVDYPEENINSKAMRVVGLRTIRDDKGERQKVELSTRELTRRASDTDKRLDDIERFNRGFGGFVDRESGIGTGAWQLVEDANNVTAEINYRFADDVKDEIEATLDVRGRAWRAPTSTARQNVAFDEEAADSFFYGNTTQLDDTNDFSNWKEIAQVSPSGTATETQSALIQVTAEKRNESLDTASEIYFRLRFDGSAVSRNTYSFGEGFMAIPSSYFNDSAAATSVNKFGKLVASLPGDYANLDNIYVDAAAPNLSDIANETVSVRASLSAVYNSPHDHFLEPEVVTSFQGNSYYPTGSVEVNGSTVATGVGNTNGTWSKTLDIAGEMSAGNNIIEFIPDSSSRGEVVMVLTTEQFRSGRS